MSEKIGIEVTATTAAAVAEIDKLSASVREQATAAENAGKGQKGLGRDVAATRAVQIEATEATRRANEATRVHTMTVQAFGAKSREAAESEAKMNAATNEAQRAAVAAAQSLQKLAVTVSDTAKAEETMSASTKRAASQVAKMSKDAEKTAADLHKMDLASKKGSGGFDIMGMASGKLMSVLGPAALGGTIIALAGWLGEASAATLQYETAVANLPFALTGAQAATHGLMSESALAVSASQALALGVVKTEAEFSQLASDAAKIALKLGTSTDKMLGDLTTALGRGSAMILDNAGIILKVSDANEAYAASVGKTVEQLDEAEKKIAFQTAAMKAIRESADATTVAYDSNAAAVARLKIQAGDTWDAMSRGAVNAFGSIVSAVYAPADAYREYMEANAKLREEGDALARDMMREQGWSQAFKDTATSIGLAAVELGGFSDVLAHFQSVMNDPQRDEKIAANLGMEREKAELMQKEAHFAELQAKALDKINKDMEAHLEAQAAASVVYGPAPPPKEEKKKRAAKPKKEMADTGDVARARIFDGRDVTEDVAADAYWTQVEIEQTAAERSYEIKQQGLAQELEILEARGQAGEEAQRAREALIDRQLNAEREFAQQQMRMAKTDATREAAQTRMEANEHQRRLVSLRRMAAAEEAEHARKVAITEKVTARVGSLGDAMVQAAWDAAEGQRGAGLQALGDYLKTVSKQMAVKALVETALGVSALAGVVTAGLAPGHFAAAGIAAGVAVAAGGAGIGLSAAGDARAASGGGKAASSAAADGPSGAGASGNTGGDRPKRELSAQDVPISYSAGMGAANGPTTTINNYDLSGGTWYAGGPEKAAQTIERIRRQGKAAGSR
jgi:hypothetical protein